MTDGRTNRKTKVSPFLDRLDRDRAINLEKLVRVSRLLKMAGFEGAEWESNTWKITAGRLIKLTGKNMITSTFTFTLSQKLGAKCLAGEWGTVSKALFLLRFHRKNQSAPNMRNFLTAVGYIAHAAENLNQRLSTLTVEALDGACNLLSQHYGEGTAYNLHKAVGEFAGHCDANGLCRTALNYKYAGMRRPENASGVGHVRLDDPLVANTKSEKLVDPQVFRVIGELYQNVPIEHKYRFYVLILALLCCLGRRFSEISLMPLQQIKFDNDGNGFLDYFPRKQSKGDVFTPCRRLYIPSVVLSLLNDVLRELTDLCASAREVAAETMRVKNVDLRFLTNISDDKKLYAKNLSSLGISPTTLSTSGWFRAHEFAKKDTSPVGHRGHFYTWKAGVIAYCEREKNVLSFAPVHIDQHGRSFFLNDLLLVRFVGLSTGAYSSWAASQCTHSMMTTFLRYFPALTEKYASTEIEVDFTSHHFRHTLNTLLDEGGLSDLLQTEWFGRENPLDTKAYQHTSREKRALMLRADLRSGDVGGSIAEQLKFVPVTAHEAFLKARITAVHDVGTGLCVHNFSQTPCGRHLQCSAECDDYVWAKGDAGRLEELKRQYALTYRARQTAEKKSKEGRGKNSIDWLLHNDKKLKVLFQQLIDNDVLDFDPDSFFEEV